MPYTNFADSTRADDEQYVLPPGSILYQDRGYQCFAVADVVIEQPTKKPCGGALTAEQKADNRRIARENMRIEHTIGSVKRCRIIKEKLWYWKETIRDMLMEIACGLHNFRLCHRPWHCETR